jgi:multidrug efflux system membrane fusion protein
MRIPFLNPQGTLRGTLGSFILASAILSAACSAGGETPAAASGGGGRGGGGGNTPTVPVSTATVEQKSVPLSISVIGASEPFHTVAVRAQITGGLTAVKFKEGDDVKEGQVLFELDRRPLEAALAQAQANLARDTAQEANARSSSARYQDLLARGIATREQADQSRTAAEALAATLEADRAAVDNAAVQLQYATIAAPISGRTGTLMVHEGNLVRANDTTPLVVINQVSPIFVSFGIPEGQLPDLKRYMAQGTVRLEASPPNETEKAVGRITFIDNAVDATTGQIKIKGTFPNEDHLLWPGQYANVIVTLKNDPNAIVVPTAAVQNGQTGNYVFVVKSDKTADIRNVVVERQAADVTVIKEGLKPGETVVVDGQNRLIGGSRISIKSGPGAPNAKVEP